MQPNSAAAALFSILLAAAAPASGEVFKVRLSSQPKTLDWHVATSGSEGAVIQNVMKGLFAMDKGGNPVPALSKTSASHWETPNKLTIALDRSVKWRDGVTLSCQHFVDSYERLLSPGLNSPNASLLFAIRGARDYFLGKEKQFANVGVRCDEKGQLKFELTEHRREFQKILTHWPAFPYRKDKPSVTLGDYELTDRAALRLRKSNPDAKGPEQAQFLVVPDGSRALLDFETGKLQYLLQLEDGLLNAGVLKTPGLGFVSPVRVVALLHVNPSRAQTSSAEARRGILKRVPLKELIAVSPETRLPAPTLIPLDSRGSALPAVPQGAASAPPSAALLLGYPNDELSRSIAQTLQEKSRELKIKIEPIAQNDYRRYDLVISLFGLDYLAAEQILSAFLSQGTLDFFNFSSAELLKRIQDGGKSRGELGPAPDYAEAVRYLQDEAAIVIPLFYRRRAYVLDPRYQPAPGAEGSAILTQLRLQNPSKNK